MTREQAWGLMTEHTQSENLRKHMLAVEAAMRHYAREFGEDEEKWAVVGLLHDFDYEQHPTAEEHPFVGVNILKGMGVAEELTRAILAHADYSGVTPETKMEKTLCAVDELTGFIVAVALMRPNKKLDEVTVDAVIKKMKNKGFARNVKREDIERGAVMLGMPLAEHIANVIAAMKTITSELGL
ncbi:MAG TPA: HDIG domain-containing protein [bacterium]